MEFQAAEDTSEVFYGGVAVTLAFPLCLPGSRTVTFYLRWLPWLTMTFITWLLLLCTSWNLASLGFSLNALCLSRCALHPVNTYRASRSVSVSPR